MCGGAMTEDVRGRDMKDRIYCRMLPVGALSSGKGGATTIKVCISDELVAQVKLTLGALYNVVGVMKNGQLHTWHITPHTDPTVALIHAKLSVTLAPSVAEIINRIQVEYDWSPWALSAMFVSQLAADVIPDSALLHLKYGLLLSLATQGQEGVPVGVVAVGADTRGAHVLMDAAAELADRRVHAHSQSLETTIKMDSSTNLIWEEAGDLMMASEGVCLLGDWSKYKKRMPRCIASLDTGLVTAETKLPSVPLLSSPLRACVWTYFGDVSPTAKDNRQIRTLIDIFGMPFLSSEPDCSEYQQWVTQLLSEQKTEAAITGAELQELLRVARSLEVRLTPAATDLVKDYFVASRRERPECLAQSAIKTITSLAEAHARLSLRKTVIPADVALVIFLYQQVITTLFGFCHMNAYKPVSRNTAEPVHAYMHRQMVQFNEWLDKFLMINNLH